MGYSFTWKFLGRNLHVIFWQLPCVFISISQIWHMKLHPCHRSFPINFVFTAFVFWNKIITTNYLHKSSIILLVAHFTSSFDHSTSNNLLSGFVIMKRAQIFVVIDIKCKFIQQLLFKLYLFHFLWRGPVFDTNCSIL